MAAIDVSGSFRTLRYGDVCNLHMTNAKNGVRLQRHEVIGQAIW